MDLKIVLLCLGLLSCVQSFQAEIVSPLLPWYLEDTDGPHFSMSLGSYPDVVYPAKKWVMRQWVYVVNSEDSDFNLMFIMNPTIRVAFSSGSWFLYIGMFSDNDPGTLTESKWIYVAMGMNGDNNAFAVVMYRGEEPIRLSLYESPSLTTNAVYQGSDNAALFTVRC
jgi:hypothetical protein